MSQLQDSKTLDCIPSRLIGWNAAASLISPLLDSNTSDLLMIAFQATSLVGM